VSCKKVTFKDKFAKAAKWTWAFGDGSKSTAQNPTHTSKNAGTYRLTFRRCTQKCHLFSQYGNSLNFIPFLRDNIGQIGK
jgi:hypothetical protein